MSAAALEAMMSHTKIVYTFQKPASYNTLEFVVQIDLVAGPGYLQ